MWGLSWGLIWGLIPVVIPAGWMPVLQGKWLLAAEAETPESLDLELRDRLLPLLKQHCVKCHGPLRQEGQLNLASPVGLARGGEHGPVVIAGDLQASRIWQRVEQDEMPPDMPLTADEKSAIRLWIADGARGLPDRLPDRLATSAFSAADRHWAFELQTRPQRPIIQALVGSRTPLDVFVQAELERTGLTLNPDAQRAALLRRMSLDMLGLPPTTDEIADFATDHDPDAFERMLDKYFASPRYGERWGKQWLDAAGYADSNGYFSADTDRPLAYRYRDYVIRAINADKPFDRFVREQVAGDEIAAAIPGNPVKPEAIELLEATHFLRNGQDGTDIGVQEPEAFEIDRRAALEAVVQVTSSSLLGLSLHCARCHDHKFDPITQREYYQFQAIFYPAFNPQDWVNPKDRLFYAWLPGEREIWEDREKRLQEQIAQLRSEHREWLAQHREPADVLFADSFADDGWKSRWSRQAPGDDQPGGLLTLDGELPNACRVRDGVLQLIAGPEEAWLSTVTAFDWTPNEPGDWIQASFDLVDNQLGGAMAERIGYLIAAHDFDDSSDVPHGNLLIDGHPSSATSIYLDYPGTDQKMIGQIGGKGYVPGHNWGVRVTNRGEGQFRLENLVDGTPDGVSKDLTESQLPPGGFAFLLCCGRSYAVDQVRVERSRPGSGQEREIIDLRREVQERSIAFEKRLVELQSQSTPQPGRAIAWVSDKSAQLPTVPFLERGQYHLRGESVQPGGLQVLTDPGFEFQVAPHDNPTSTGYRLAFAEWLTSASSRPAALMARVQVNRIWSQYFGTGIVPTTDNLGMSGAAPQNLHLLEELAHSLQANGWSQKLLQRKILVSSTYRQSSAAHPQGLARDTDNRRLWRAPLRRLDAETIRDSMLVASGDLDLTSFGPYVPTQQTAVGEVVVDEQTPGAHRRSVYLQQRRSQTLSLLRVFDAPAIATICTTRRSSTVPLQSLALLNSEFVLARGGAMARRVWIESGGTAVGSGVGSAGGATVGSAGGAVGNAIRLAWRLAIGREPTPAEFRTSVEFFDGQLKCYPEADAAQSAMSDFCQMLLAGNAFLYLE